MRKLLYISFASILFVAAISSCSGSGSEQQKIEDSIRMADSIARVDSIRTADSIAAAKADSLAKADSIAKVEAELAKKQEEASMVIDNLLNQMDKLVKQYIRNGDGNAAMKANNLSIKISSYYNQMTPAQKKRWERLKQCIMG